MSASVPITVKNLKIGYEDVVVLRDISFEVRRGEVFAILGGSGCGKSTLLKHMIGLFTPMEGEVWIEGVNMAAAQGEERLRALRSIGVTYQGGALFGSMSVLENVRLPLDAFTDLPMEAKDMIARAKLESVGMEDAAPKMPAELSGGMQKRAAIARAMAMDPGILFLDEPSAGLDPVTSAELDALILNLSRGSGITFVIVTHELPSIYAIASRVIMLDGVSKTLIAEGDPRDLRDHSPIPWVRQFFNRQSAATP